MPPFYHARYPYILWKAVRVCIGITLGLGKKYRYGALIYIQFLMLAIDGEQIEQACIKAENPQIFYILLTWRQEKV
ncbi:hypothetical protein D0466_21745 [Peribacillus glennii]|uniref:Uncharacterized protein n=1 Tax=Peribacillus glennii TaxID=2303991 RepID=A0A372L660_9BACI|nr:hypothetical protein D0466_21745 [Peribacillus glennii]